MSAPSYCCTQHSPAYLWVPSLLPQAGTPGIGKTAFQFPLMHFLVKQGVATTMVVQTKTERLLFSTSPGSTVRRGSLLDFEAELHDERTW